MVMRPSWMGPDPVEVAVERMLPQWREMARKSREEEEARAERLREMWAGIEVGDVVELIEEEGLRRGGLRMVGVDGEVKLMQVRVMGIEGEFARVRVGLGGKYGGMYGSELVRREVISGVVREGLIVREVEERKWWEE